MRGRKKEGNMVQGYRGGGVHGKRGKGYMRRGAED